jgi:hypothetical protein
MANFIQVIDGKVVNHWDIPHTLPSPVGTDGWLTTVEIIPEIREGRQFYGDYTYDVSKNPVVISREIIEISVGDRKQNMLDQLTLKFKEFAEILEKNPLLYTSEEIAENKQILKSNKNSILSSATHDDLDNIIPVDLTLF